MPKNFDVIRINFNTLKKIFFQDQMLSNSQEITNRVEFNNPSLVKIKVGEREIVCLMESILGGQKLTDSIIREIRILMEFSDFTFRWSDEKFIVDNLQGTYDGSKIFSLTNAVIHSVKGTFGPTDRSEEGINEFCRHHLRYCTFANIPEFQHFFSNLI